MSSRKIPHFPFEKYTCQKYTFENTLFLFVQEWKLPDNQNRNWQPTIFWSNLSENIWHSSILTPDKFLGPVAAKLFENPKVWLTDKSTNGYGGVGARDANSSINQLINIYFMSITMSYYVICHMTCYQNIQSASRNPDSVTGWLTRISSKPVYTLFGPDLHSIV